MNELIPINYNSDRPMIKNFREQILLADGEPYQAVVSFSLPYPDWCELQKSADWKNLISPACSETKEENHAPSRAAED